MAEQEAVFRFDIYERVLIPDDFPAIASLEEAELKPDVRAEPGGGQSLLKGCLELTAVYEADRQPPGKETFVHRIPVEISLPIRGDTGLIDRIQVRIEQFDVELISRRSLNVTGVLSLEGWEDAAAGAREEGGEELVAVHDAENAADPSSYGKAAEERGEPPQPESAAAAGAGALTEKPRSEDELKEMLEAEAQGLYDEQANAENEAASDLAEDAGEAAEGKDANEAVFAEFAETENEAFDEAAETLPGIAEPKLAFKPAKAPDTDRFGEGGGPDQSGQSAEPKANNALHWKSLFLSKEEGTKFRSMRLCIVQKDDTLHSIAERYQLHPREIELLNRLGDEGLSEGQILYIPTK